MADMWSDEGLPTLHFHITQLLTRYARAVDRPDFGLLRTLFHPDAVDEHGFTAGDLEEFIDSYSHRSALVQEMMHVNTNTLILDRDHRTREALVETYCVAWNRVLAEDVVPGSLHDSPLIPIDSPHDRVATIANRYLDLIAERDGQLRFLFRRVVFEWVTVAEISPVSPFGPAMRRSSRDSTDPSHQTLASVRRDYLLRRAEVHPGAS